MTEQQGAYEEDFDNLTLNNTDRDYLIKTEQQGAVIKHDLITDNLDHLIKGVNRMADLMILQDFVTIFFVKMQFDCLTCEK